MTMSVDYSLMGGVPQAEPGIQNPLPQNNVATPVSGYEDSPLIKELNKRSYENHDEIHGPVVKSIMKVASPEATGEDRLQASKLLSNANFNTPNSEQTHWGELIKGLVSGDYATVNNAWNGGADRREEGIDSLGRKFYKVYNQRGEFRRNEDINFKPLSPTEEEEIGGIASKSDMTQAQGKLFQVTGANFGEVAKTQAGLFNNAQKSSVTSAYNAPTIVTAAQRNKVIAPQLYSASVDPATRAMITGIDTMGSGDTRAIQNSAKAMKSLIKGDKTSKEAKNIIDSSDVINFGLQYKEGTGLTDSKGKVQSAEDVDDRANEMAKNQSSTASITSRKDDLAAKAQILAAKTQLPLDLINEYINNNYQIALAKKQIEDAGGIPGIKPNLPQSVMDSFYAGHIKSIQDETYGKVADMWAQFVENKKQNMRPGQVPDVTKWVLEFNSNPEIKKMKFDNATEADRIHKLTPTNTQASDTRNVNSTLVSNARAGNPTVSETEVKIPKINKENPVEKNERKFHWEEGINPANGKKARRKVYE